MTQDVKKLGRENLIRLYYILYNRNQKFRIQEIRTEKFRMQNFSIGTNKL